MSHLSRIRALYSLKEDPPGTASDVATLHNPDNGVLAYDLTTEPDYQDLPLDIAGPSASHQLDETGREIEKFSFATNVYTLGGSLDSVIEPLTGKFLQSAGLRHHRLKSFAAQGSVSNASFVFGERIVNASLQQKGWIQMAPAVGSSPTRVILYQDGADVQNGEVLFGATSTASITAAVAADYKDHGHLYIPSTPHHLRTEPRSGAVTGAFLEREIVVGATSGAVGRLWRPFDDHSAAGQFQIEPILGTFVAETITGQTSGATAVLAGTGFAHTSNALSIGISLHGYFIQARGCRATWKLNMSAGEPARFMFEYMGVQHLRADRPILPTEAGDPGTVLNLLSAAKRFSSANLTIDDLSIRLRNLNLDFGGNLVPMYHPSFTHGIETFRIAGRQPVGTLDPEWMPKAAYDYRGKWTALSPAQIKVRFGVPETDIYIPGSGYELGHNYYITIPAAQYNAIPFGDRDGIRTADASFRMKRDQLSEQSMGDDEIQIIII